MTYDELLEKHQLDPDCAGGIGNGWVPTVDTLFGDLIALGWDKDLRQLKEKFGGLRVYVGASTAEMQRLIDIAEIECGGLCEDCGQVGDLRAEDYIRTLCNGCNNKDREPAQCEILN